MYAHGDARDGHVIHAREGHPVLCTGPAIDIEDGPRSFGAHSDQDRILESELHRFVSLNWDIVSSLARANSVTVP